MRYDNLQDLIRSSQSGRKYFLSLPVSVQTELHNHNNYVHSLEQLYIRAELVQKNMQYIKNGGWLN